MNNFCITKTHSRSKVLRTGILFLLPFFAHAQQPEPGAELKKATLEEVVDYAIKHQPIIQQSLIDQKTTETTIKGKLADWYPQLNFNYSLIHNFVIQPTLFQGNIARFGASNTSLAQFALSQTIFNRDALLAKNSASDVRTQAVQKTSSSKIDVAANVTKAFYDVLATTQQIKVGQGDVIRLRQNLKTAYDQYAAGLVDKTDYKRATITLSNTEATLKINMELLNYKLEYLKLLMGYPPGGELNLTYDSLQMENEILLDTLQPVDYTNRIDYKLLVTQRRLQEASIHYSYWSFLPTVAINGAYNFYYLNAGAGIPISDIYRTNTPYSFAALTLSLPLFQGGKRIANIKQQQWTMKRLDWDITNLKNTVSSQYAQALAAYKSNLVSYQTLKQNVVLAKEVYDIIQLQYKTGVKSYLEVITAETDLRTARINYFNALYAVLSSKIDVQKALGQINY